MFDLSGKTALITGAGRGMGVGIARCLASAGASVIINDISERSAHRTAEQLQSEGFEAKPLAFDVTSLEDFEEAIRSLGGVDILVSNAGIVRVSQPGDHFARFADSRPESWQAQFDLNVFGVMNGVRAVLPGMRKNAWGRIVTVSSDSGRKGGEGLSIYASAKAAGLEFTKCVAVEEGANGVTANTVSLGLMENAAQTNDEQLKAYFDSLLARTPVARPGTGHDVGAAITYLCSNEAAWVTGQNLPVNGGFDTF
ncbi:MAG: SDR family NAD(P)-dependent oxidoreductase [Pseudomonadales bacterium]